MYLRNKIPYIEGTDPNDPENTIYLFADSYGTHHSAETLDYAKTLNISVIEIPKGTTDQCQPLDCVIFGMLKSQARAYYNKRVGKHIRNHYKDLREGVEIPPLEKFTIQQSAYLLDLLWNDIKEYQINSAWHKAFAMDRDEDDIATEEDMNFIEKENEEIDDEMYNEEEEEYDNQNENVNEDENDKDDKNSDLWI